MSLGLLISCSNNSESSSENNSQVVAEVPMPFKIDGVPFDGYNQTNTNLADISGGVLGNTYFRLEGIKNTLSNRIAAKIGGKTYYVNLFIPKNDLSLGSHTFTSAPTIGGYFAKLTITSTPAEVVGIIGGQITISSYDSTTKKIKGTFAYNTNDNVNLSTQTHNVTGSFSYILQ